MNKNLIITILLPFLGTTLGSACVFIMRNELKVNTRKILAGFAAGVMVAASIWSLLIPAIEQSEKWESYHLYLHLQASGLAHYFCFC